MMSAEAFSKTNVSTPAIEVDRYFSAGIFSKTVGKAIIISDSTISATAIAKTKTLPNLQVSHVYVVLVGKVIAKTRVEPHLRVIEISSLEGIVDLELFSQTVQRLIESDTSEQVLFSETTERKVHNV
jgi:hypothetical protein